MIPRMLFGGLTLATLVVMAEPAMAQSSRCSNDGGYPPGSPGAVMAGIRDLSSGAYAACLERERANQPRAAMNLAEVRAAARHAVRSRLREPASAAFRGVAMTEQSNGATTFCGEVSGPNGFGGMSPYMRFRAAVTVYGEAFAEFDEGELAARTHFETGWRRYCSGGVATAF
jgi:hypothetical protein